MSRGKGSKVSAGGSRSASVSTSTQDTAGAAKENAKWTLEDEKAFVGYLTDHVAERGDGNYKMTTFNAAAAYLEGRRTAGGPKTGTGCKNKWARIKETYMVCYKLKQNHGTSGFTWSEEKGADIGIEDEPIWEAYIKKNPKADHFKNKGWPLYDAVDRIIPDKVKGKNLFAASQAPVPNPQSSDNPEGNTSETDGADEEASQDPADVYIPPPAPPAPPSGRKRSALEAENSVSTPSPSGSFTTQRPPRDTAVSRSIDRMSEVLAVIAGPTSGAPTDVSLESTPKRRRIAVELAAKQEDEELSEDDMVELVEVMRRDISAADTYLSLSKANPKLRRAWVRRVVNERYS
ncbi:hypothetical protein BN946_scf184971.g2 [Trametes cinnabarina]|uniref:Myb/SANT-like domain-containing protein n=1 Tax=Pycnoporus cinnabarinus TaxID=5643 RepID=A0A060SQ77_PYCCI|nr:hypothetical protein BN946_scf184863.g2 [Trametes cinnabarina]CDO74613.1 hypothetical protein BN946_scf184599.g6 [Trametes cinnabarina]CDO77952.1 hypothetical protein BN946_scf184971.g2 [Trametes cinnabarina]